MPRPSRSASSAFAAPGASAAAGRARDRLRRAHGPAVPHGPDAAAASQRHALHRLRRRGRNALPARLSIPSAAASSCAARTSEAAPEEAKVSVPFPFDSAAELLAQCRRHDMNDPRTGAGQRDGLAAGRAKRARGCWTSGRSCKTCVRQGFEAQGVLPGVLKVPRRAPRLYRELLRRRRCRRLHGLGERLRAGRQRGERRGRARGHGADQRRGRDHARGAALLPSLRQRRRRGGRDPFPAHRRRHRHPLQEERLDLRRRDGLPGRGRRGLLDGCGRAGGGAGRQQRAGRERARRSAWSTTWG